MAKTAVPTSRCPYSKGRGENLKNLLYSPFNFATDQSRASIPTPCNCFLIWLHNPALTSKLPPLHWQLEKAGGND